MTRIVAAVILICLGLGLLTYCAAAQTAESARKVNASSEHVARSTRCRRTSWRKRMRFIVWRSGTQ